MENIIKYLLDNNNIANNEDNPKKNNNDYEELLSNLSFDDDTIPDEDFNKMNNKKRNKLKSCPNVEHKGPNINLKINHKRYSNQKEKQFFLEKIKKKKKTELCKNYELYHDCYYGDNCCFAHGIDELREKKIQEQKEIFKKENEILIKEKEKLKMKEMEEDKKIEEFAKKKQELNDLRQKKEEEKMKKKLQERQKLIDAQFEYLQNLQKNEDEIIEKNVKISRDREKEEERIKKELEL